MLGKQYIIKIWLVYARPHVLRGVGITWTFRRAGLDAFYLLALSPNIRAFVTITVVVCFFFLFLYETTLGCCSWGAVPLSSCHGRLFFPPARATRMAENSWCFQRTKLLLGTGSECGRTSAAMITLSWTTHGLKLSSQRRIAG